MMNRRFFLKTIAALGCSLSVRPSWAAEKAPFLSGIHLLMGRSPVEKYFWYRFKLDLNRIYWGDIHNHSNFSSDARACGGPSCLSPTDALIYARDTAGLDFVAITDHAEMRSSFRGVANNWESYQEIVKSLNDEDSFIIFPGWEYTNTVGLAPDNGSFVGYGHKNIIFRDLTGLPTKMIGAFDIPGSSEIVVAETCSDLWANLSAYSSQGEKPATAATIIHTPAMCGDSDAHDHQTHFEYMHSSFVRSIEIYSKWGSSEGEAPGQTGCNGGDTLVDYDPSIQVASKTIRPLLYTNWVQNGNSEFLLGFTGSTDNHMGQPANTSEGQCGLPCRGGVTGIATPVFSRTELWQALFDRHTMAATDDCRAGLLFAVETGGKDLLMGDVGSHDNKMCIRALADRGVDRLEIILDGCLLESVPACEVERSYDLTSGNHYVYVKAIKELGSTVQASWSSPVYLSDTVV